MKNDDFQKNGLGSNIVDANDSMVLWPMGVEGSCILPKQIALSLLDHGELLPPLTNLLGSRRVGVRAAAALAPGHTSTRQSPKPFVSEHRWMSRDFARDQNPLTVTW